VPDNADLPDLPLKPLLAGAPNGVTILLGLPIWHESRANALDLGPSADVRAKLIYRVRTEQVVDENNGQNPQPLHMRRLNARLLHENDDLTDLETVPVARVIPGVGETVGQPRLDPEYIAPSVFVQSSPRLYELIRNLVDQVQASHKELLGQINRASLSLETMHGHQFEQVLRLRTLSRFAGRLPALVRASHITPFTWYLELRELLGELTALKLGQESFEAPDYDHEGLYHSFKELSDRVRALLSTTVTAAFLKVEFRKEPQFFAATLTDEQFTKPVDFFIAIKTSQDYGAVRQLVQDGNRFKLMPKSMATKAFFGVRLNEEKFPPHFLPNQPGLHYFRVMRKESERVWERIQSEHEMSIVWPEFATTDFQITLYLILPG
jgi:type VI secretion system ImpJ/VasE family protein